MQSRKIPKAVLPVLAAAALVCCVPGSVAARTRVDYSPPSIDSLPQIQHQGEVSYVSGGIGLDESTAIKREASRWPLSLLFADHRSEYVSHVDVRITRAGGDDVLTATSAGPYMLVRLRPGAYVVHATGGDVERTAQVVVSAAGTAKVSFTFDR